MRATRACSRRRRVAVGPGVWALGIALAVSSRAGAADAPPDANLPIISLDMSACPYDEAEVRRLLAIELEAKVIGPASRTGDMSSVAVTCADDVYRIVVVSRTDPSKMRQRELDLASTGPKARARFLALAMIELITTRWPAPPPPVVTPPPEPPRPVAEVVATAPRLERPTVRFAAGAVTRAFPSGAGSPTTWGAAVRSSWIRGALELACDVVAESGRSDVPLGEVGAKALSLSPTVGAVGGVGRWGWRTGAGARLGIARLEGRSTDAGEIGARSFSAPWGGPVITAAGLRRIAQHWSVELGAELGWAIASVVGRTLDDGGRSGADVAWRGPWAALGLTLGWSTP